MLLTNKTMTGAQRVRATAVEHVRSYIRAAVQLVSCQKLDVDVLSHAAHWMDDATLCSASAACAALRRRLGRRMCGRRGKRLQPRLAARTHMRRDELMATVPKCARFNCRRDRAHVLCTEPPHDGWTEGAYLVIMPGPYCWIHRPPEWPAHD